MDSGIYGILTKDRELYGLNTIWTEGYMDRGIWIGGLYRLRTEDYIDRGLYRQRTGDNIDRGLYGLRTELRKKDEGFRLIENHNLNISLAVKKPAQLA